MVTGSAATARGSSLRAERLEGAHTQSTRNRYEHGGTRHQGQRRRHEHVRACIGWFDAEQQTAHELPGAQRENETAADSASNEASRMRKQEPCDVPPRGPDGESDPDFLPALGRQET